MPSASVSLEALGWNASRAQAFQVYSDKGFEPGRVAIEDKHYYAVITSRGELTGQIAGRLLHAARTPAALPKVGDWVALAPIREETKAIIHAVLDRKSKLCRKVPGREVQEQVLVANVDLVFLVQALDQTFNPALLYRHLTATVDSGILPVVVLNKADLCEDIPARLDRAREVAGDWPVVVVSAKTKEGIEGLAQLIHPGETVVLVGPSGVGKSTLINDLLGEEVQTVGEVRESDSKGRHVTTWRELICLPSGGVVVDTPGMREFQMWLPDRSSLDAYADIEELATRCHFPNCRHETEKRCAVREAVAKGELSVDRLENYVKLKSEVVRFEQAHAQRGRMERKRQSKAVFAAQEETRASEQE